MREPGLDPKRLMIAAHELGHAITWHASGLPIAKIQIKDSWLRGLHGEVELGNGYTNRTPAQDRAHLIGFATGPVAGAMWCATTGQRLAEAERGDGADWEVIHLLRRRHPWAKAMSIRTIKSEAVAVVQKHWDKITSLAPRLAENGRIIL